MTDIKRPVLLLTAANAPVDSYAAIYAASMVEALPDCSIITFAIGKKNIGASNLAPDCVKDLAEQAVKIGQAAGAKIVVALLASPIIVLTAAKVAAALGAELVTIAADTMETMVASNKELAPFSSVLINEFNKLIAGSTKCAAITGSGHDHITTQLHKPCELLPLPLDLKVTEGTQQRTPAIFRIACHIPLAISQATFNKFFHALSRLAQRPDAAKIVFDLIGGYQECDFAVSTPTENLELNRVGRLSAAHTLRTMSKADLVYVCAPLEQKLSTAQEFTVRLQQAQGLQAGSHLLFHGQEAYCLPEILANKELGLCVSDIGDQHIEQVLTELIDAPTTQKSSLSTPCSGGSSKEKINLIWAALLG